nr:glycosyltransferase [Clostridium sp. AM45-5]
MDRKILYIVEAMGGGVFTYIVDLANELVNKYDMYIAYAVRKQTPKNYKDYFDKRIHLIEVKNFGRAINPTKDIAAFFEVKKIAAEVKPDVIHLWKTS